MANTLGAWSARCEDVLADLEAQMKTIREEAKKKAREDALSNESVRAAELAGRKKEDGDAMDVDSAGADKASRRKGQSMGMRKR